MTFIALSSRTADQWILQDTSLINIDGDISQAFALPASFGDLLLLDALVVVSSVLTMRLTPEDGGVEIDVVTAGALVADYVGVGRWHQVSVARLAAYIDPDQLRFVRQDELIVVRFAEVDTNVAPTADLSVFLRVRRLREDSTRPRFLGPFTPRPVTPVPA